MPAPSDLVHETTTSTGTGNLTVTSESGKRTFNTAFGTGGSNLFDYFISHRTAAEWEIGTGHLSASTTFVRDTVISSSNANAAVNFSAGTKDVTNDVRATNQAKLDVEDQTLAGGVRVTEKDLGTVSSGTTTPDPGDRPIQKYTNGGAHTLAPGSNVGAYLLTIVNNGSAGAITTSGWTKVAGDSFTTTNGHKFRCHCSVTGDGSVLIVQAMQ